MKFMKFVKLSSPEKVQLRYVIITGNITVFIVVCAYKNPCCSQYKCPVRIGSGNFTSRFIN